MKYILSFLLLTLLAAPAECQEETYRFDLFKVEISGPALRVYDSYNNIIFTREFSSPQSYSVDLDGDSVDEFLVVDSFKDKGRRFYSLYIFNTIDSFYLADTINSGLTEPYPFKSAETGGMIIVSGDSRFYYLNKDTADVFLPIYCWKYESGKILPANDELYDIFISENDQMADIVDDYMNENGKSCASSEAMKAAIAAVYANYMHAAEKSLASQFLKKYYNCSDLKEFQQSLNGLL